jgi:hypothetical protein
VRLPARAGARLSAQELALLGAFPNSCACLCAQGSVMTLSTLQMAAHQPVWGVWSTVCPSPAAPPPAQPA